MKQLSKKKKDELHEIRGRKQFQWRKLSVLLPLQNRIKKTLSFCEPSTIKTEKKSENLSLFFLFFSNPNLANFLFFPFSYRMANFNQKYCPTPCTLFLISFYKAKTGSLFLFLQMGKAEEYFTFCCAWEGDHWARADSWYME